MTELTHEGARLVAAFLGAQQSVEQAKERLNGAECDLSNAHNALAKWLMPTDMKPGEKVAVWMGDSLFQVELEARTAVEVCSGTQHMSYEPKVTVRSRGKHFDRLRSVG